MDLLAFSGYPPFADIVSSVALTFFAFLGFGVITFTAKDLADPERQLPRAVYLALAIATVVYLGVSIGVFGTLTFQEVLESGGTALAVAAEPTLGQAGYWMITVTTLFATAGATNSGLSRLSALRTRWPPGASSPPAMGARIGAGKARELHHRSGLAEELASAIAPGHSGIVALVSDPGAVEIRRALELADAIVESAVDDVLARDLKAAAKEG